MSEVFIYKNKYKNIEHVTQKNFIDIFCIKYFTLTKLFDIMSLSEFRWHLSQVVRPGSAKPPCLSSNLRGASNFFFLSSDKHAGVAESADAQDLKSCGVTTVPVQVWSPAPKRAVALFLCPDLIEQRSMVCKHTELVLRTCISRKYVIVQKISIGVYSIT